MNERDKEANSTKRGLQEYREKYLFRNNGMRKKEPKVTVSSISFN